MSQPDIITISSYNAPQNESSANFEAVLANTVINPKRMALSKFVMPNFIYPWNASNNQLIISVLDTPTSLAPIVSTATVLLPTGIYWSTGSAFATSLTTLINTALFTTPSFGTSISRCANPITVSFDSTTGKITFTANQNCATSPTLASPNATLSYKVGLQSYWTATNSSTCLYKMGFTAIPNYGLTFTQTSFTGDCNLNLMGAQIIYVSCSLLGNSVNDKTDPITGLITGDQQIFATIPVSCNFGELLVYQDIFGEFVSTCINNIRNIRIQLLDETYTQLTLGNNTYCTMEFRATY